MNSIMNGNSTHVPAFLVKLWRIVNEPATNDLISWSETGNSFIIHNQSKFAHDLLHRYYKHSNMASFVRQLNMYGFHKVISVEQGGLRPEKEEMEFAHPFFRCGSEASLELIKRKISAAKTDDSRGRPENFNQVLIDVRQMKGKQETMDNKLLQMKRENDALWRELSVLRQKHVKQQQIVSKLLQFLVSMMSTQSHRIGFKRRLPLMLADSEDQKSPKQSRPAEAGEASPQGPVIHDVTEEEPLIILSLPDSVEADDSDEPDPNAVSNLLTRAAAVLNEVTNAGTSATTTKITTTSSALNPGKMITEPIEQPTEINLPDFTASNENTEQGQTESIDDKDQVPSTPTVADLLGFQYPMAPEKQQLSHTQSGEPSSDVVVSSRNALDEHLGEMQNGLANLKDLLQDGYNIDMDTLSGLFGHQSSDILGLGQLNSNEGDGNGNIETGIDGFDLGAGSEMVPYNPCLFELAEDDTHFFEDTSNQAFLEDELEAMLTTDKGQLSDVKR